jgi:hypothetical protein
MLLMACGVGTLVVLFFTRNIVTQCFQNLLNKLLLWAAISLLCLGVIGACSVWSWNRCYLCTFAWLAVFVGIGSAVAGIIVFIQPSNAATRLERLCEEANSTSALINLHASAEVVAAQKSYDSMREALLACRRQNAMAIRLDACPDAVDSAKNPWRSNPHRGLFRWLEKRYACSGFCRDAPPLFGLPENAVNENNRGQARHACFSAVAVEMRRQALPSAGILFGAGIFLLCPASCACWLACAPPPFRRKNYTHHPEDFEWTAVPQEEESDTDSIAGNSYYR